MNPLKLLGPRTWIMVLGLLVIELLLGRAGFGKWVVQEQNLFLGWQMLPEQDGWSRDLSVPEHINRWGYRDSEWTAPVQDAQGRWRKDPKFYRVAVVGNSFTYGTSVEASQIYSEQLQTLLGEQLRRAGDPRQVEVMNFAVQGYTLDQMVRAFYGELSPQEQEDYRSRGEPLPVCQRVPIRAWQVDLLVVPTLSNDITPMRPSRDDPDFGLRQQVIRTASYDWLRKQVIEKWISGPRRDPSTLALSAPNAPPSTAQPSFEEREREWSKLEAELKNRAFAEENRKYWYRAGKQLARLRATLEAEGGRLLVFVVPRIDSLLNPQIPSATLFWEGVWEQEQLAGDAQASLLVFDPMPGFAPRMSELTRELLEFSRTHKDGAGNPSAFVIDDKGLRHLPPQLPSLDQSLYLVDDPGHFSAKGHAAIAEAILRELLAAKWLPEAP